MVIKNMSNRIVSFKEHSENNGLVKPIPTAEEFLFDYSINDEIDYLSKSSKELIIDKLIIFTQLHVEAALKEIVEDYSYYLEGDEGSERVNAKKFLKEAYPLTNIK